MVVTVERVVAVTDVSWIVVVVVLLVSGMAIVSVLEIVEGIVDVKVWSR